MDSGAAENGGNGGEVADDAGGEASGQSGTAGEGGSEACEPITCDQVEDCGPANDGCGRMLNCPCDEADPGCEPTSCEAEQKNCGIMDDGCDATLECGTCDSPETCGGGGEANVCGCSARECTENDCGSMSDGCGGTIDCGDCSDGRECGLVTRNVCGCPEAELVAGPRHAQGARSTSFSGTSEQYAELYEVHCSTPDDCIGPCEERGGTTEMCEHSECIDSTDDYCLPPTVWRNVDNLRFESGETTGSAVLTLVNGMYDDTLVAHDFKLEVPEVAEITGITVNVRRASGREGDAVDGAVRIVKSGSIGDADRSSPTPWAAEMENAVYGGIGDLWGETWTPAEVSSPSFGVAMTVLYTRGAGNGRAYIDTVYITVHYRLACQ